MNLLKIPWTILVGTMQIAAMLSLTIVGIPIAAMVVVCGIGLAVAATALIAIPAGILLIGLL